MALRTVSFGVFTAGLLTACPDPAVLGPAPTVSPVVAEKADTRYMKIRGLLELPPQSRARATQLFGLVRPLCDEPEARAKYLETAAWSVGFADAENHLPIGLALDALEYIAGVCGRISAEGTMELLEGAAKLMPKEPRIHVLLARAHAVAGRLEVAAAEAKTAMEAGSAHAVALAAALEARSARAGEAGYAPGMFDAALAIARTEPSANWPAVDLAAVLSTRARLLLEVGIWADGPTSRAALEEARATLQRILKGPFPTAVRSRAADLACFEAVAAKDEAAKELCRSAAESFGHVGAARFAGTRRVAAEGPEAGPAPSDRNAAFNAWSETLDALPAHGLVVVGFRGDEAELREWARPAAALLRRIARRKADLLVIDRSAGGRATEMMERILELAEVKPWRRIDGRKSTQTTPCVAALLADRQAPGGCPLDEATRSALLERDAPAFALLVGRDLDAEIDDLRLYAHPVVLASFRRSEMEKKGIEAWLKSVSDVWAVVPAP